MATNYFGLDYLTGDDPDFSLEESESLITIPMATAHVHLSIKLGRGIAVGYPSTKHMPLLFKSNLISY